MIPVEEGRISLDLQSATDAASWHMREASFLPWAPVQALALPALTTTPRSAPDLICSRPTTTAGETTWLVVNAAAALAG